MDLWIYGPLGLVMTGLLAWLVLGRGRSRRAVSQEPGAVTDAPVAGEARDALAQAEKERLARQEEQERVAAETMKRQAAEEKARLEELARQAQARAEAERLQREEARRKAEDEQRARQVAAEKVELERLAREAELKAEAERRALAEAERQAQEERRLRRLAEVKTRAQRQSQEAETVRQARLAAEAQAAAERQARLEAERQVQEVQQSRQLQNSDNTALIEQARGHHTHKEWWDLYRLLRDHGDGSEPLETLARDIPQPGEGEAMGVKLVEGRAFWFPHDEIALHRLNELEERWIPVRTQVLQGVAVWLRQDDSGAWHARLEDHRQNQSEDPPIWLETALWPQPLPVKTGKERPLSPQGRLHWTRFLTIEYETRHGFLFLRFQSPDNPHTAVAIAATGQTLKNLWPTWRDDVKRTWIAGL